MLDEQSITDIVLRTYPRATGIAHVHMQRFRGPITGAENAHITVAYQTAQGGIVDVHLQAKETTRGEYEALTILNKRSHLLHRVPRPIAYENDTLLYERVWGDSLRRFPFQSRSKELPGRFRAIGRFLGRVHTTPAPAALPRHNTKARFAALQERFAAIHESHPDIGKISLAPLPKAPPTFSRTLVHGDFQASNVFFTLPEGDIGVIDWSDAHFGNPSFDLASFSLHTALMLNGILSPAAIRRALDAFHRTYRVTVRRRKKDLAESFDVSQTAIALDILDVTLQRFSPDRKPAEREAFLKAMQSALLVSSL